MEFTQRVNGEGDARINFVHKPGGSSLPDHESQGALHVQDVVRDAVCCKFISTKTKRPFKAYLVVERKKDEVKVGFDFPPREPKRGKEAAETKEAPAAKVTKTAVATKSVKAIKAPARKK